MVGVIGWPLRVACVHPPVLYWWRVCWAVTVPETGFGAPGTIILGVPPCGLN